MTCPVQGRLPRRGASLGAKRGLAPTDKFPCSIREFAAGRGYPLGRVGAFGQGEKRRRMLFRNFEGNRGNMGTIDGQFAVIVERISA